MCNHILKCYKDRNVNVVELCRQINRNCSVHVPMKSSKSNIYVCNQGKILCLSCIYYSLQI